MLPEDRCCYCYNCYQEDLLTQLKLNLEGFWKSVTISMFVCL